jgi:hypothetical protein
MDVCAYKHGVFVSCKYDLETDKYTTISARITTFSKNFL